MLIGGIVGGMTGYLLQYYVTVIYFPINIAGRPLHSWPSYIVITFEMTILFAALSAVLGPAGAVRICPCRTIRSSMCRDSRWPRAIASSCASRRAIRCSTATKTSEFLETLEPKEVSEVAP